MGGSLKGYKTYIVAGLTILSCTAAYLDGDLAKGQALQAIITAVLSITVRNGITTELKKLTGL